MDTMRSDWSPNIFYKDGTWVTIVICDHCRLHALREDCHPANPCPRCGNRLREAVGKWERLSPKWKFWRNVGRWNVKGEK